MTRSFSAPWNSGALSERIEALIRAMGKPELGASGACGYQTTISSGLGAKLVNVWGGYRLEIYAVAPSALPPYRTLNARVRVRMGAL